MNFLGVHLRILMGDARTRPPRSINEALQSVEVTHSDEGRSGFQLTFQIGRGLTDLRDYALVKNELLQPFKRVILAVIFNAKQYNLMDGIITNHQLSPSNDPGASTLTLTGGDISLMMELEQVPEPNGSQVRQYPRMTDFQILEKILKDRYSRFNIKISGRDSQSRPGERTPTQPLGTTDLAYIEDLARNHGYVFYTEPGESPGENIAYWGRPQYGGELQPPLSANMGPNTNIESISFQYNGMAARRIMAAGEIISRNEEDNERPLVENVAEPRVLGFGRGCRSSSNVNEARMLTRDENQGHVNRSFDNVVTATGELDALRYGRLLQPRRLVDIRGVGWSYDGTYYVKSVTHRIDVRKGEYKQNFTLARQGLGSTKWRV